MTAAAAQAETHLPVALGGRPALGAKGAFHGQRHAGGAGTTKRRWRTGRTAAAATRRWRLGLSHGDDGSPDCGPGPPRDGHLCALLALDYAQYFVHGMQSTHYIQLITLLSF